MSAKEAILKNFDDLAIAKKNGRSLLAIIVFFSFAVIIAILVWTFSIVSAAADKIKVVDTGGQYLKTSLENKEKLFRSLIQSHCANVVYYANSFDRLTIKENQAKALFLMSKNDAFRIFSRYKDQHAYTESIDRGVQYKTEFEKLEELRGNEEPYHVVFSSILTIQDNDKPLSKVRIFSEGDLISHTAQYPENTSGFYFKTYAQTYEKIEAHD